MIRRPAEHGPALTRRVFLAAAALAAAVLAGAVLAALLAAGCSRHRAAARPRNVIFVLVDTLRADHLNSLGYGRPTAPNLAALARHSVLFTAARSQASCTFPSVNSLLTSRSPALFLDQPGGGMGLPAQLPGLAEILHARGFRTVAISASPIVRKSPSRFNPKGGYDRGFELFREECVWQPADCVTGLAAASLRRDPRPLLLYLHYMDPHGPYAMPAAYPHRFARGDPGNDSIRRGDPNPIAARIRQGLAPGVTAGELAYLVDLYDDKISFFDSQLAVLLATLRAAGLMEDSILVLAADHGEEFLEHGEVKHCNNLFDTTIHTPLLLAVPGLAGGRRIAAPVENLDIVPTLLDYLGIVPPPRAAFEGRSLRPLMEGATPPPSFQTSAQGPLRALSDGRLKLVEDLATGRSSLYDLLSDPAEARDILPSRRRDFHRLHDALLAHLARTEGPSSAAILRRSSEAARRLRAVGYLE